MCHMQMHLGPGGFNDLVYIYLHTFEQYMFYSLDKLEQKTKTKN